jgi:hypothetical protein
LAHSPAMRSTHYWSRHTRNSSSRSNGGRICISTYTPLCACLAVDLISAFMIHSHWLEVFWNNFSNFWFVLL